MLGSVYDIVNKQD